MRITRPFLATVLLAAATGLTLLALVQVETVGRLERPPQDLRLSIAILVGAISLSAACAMPAWFIRRISALLGFGAIVMMFSSCSLVAVAALTPGAGLDVQNRALTSR